MKNSLLIVIFSFNRALQLNSLLKSIFERIKNMNYKIAIIYHCSDPHKLSYEKLQEEYKFTGKLSFHERSYSISCTKSKLKFLFNFWNLIRFAKHGYLRKKCDNFKTLTEQIINDSNTEFTMFLTDDGYFYEDVNIPTEILNNIRESPKNVSYRMYVGDNLSNFPSKNIIKKNNFYCWKYSDKNLNSHWSYPFAIDATIYNSKALLDTIKPVLYHMPTTLEGYVVHKCKRKKIFNIGYSPLKSNYVGIFLNRVSTISKNYSGAISPALLNKYFLEGYSLNYVFGLPPKKQAFIPEKIILTKNNSNEVIFDLSMQKELLH